MQIEFKIMYLNFLHTSCKSAALIYSVNMCILIETPLVILAESQKNIRHAITFKRVFRKAVTNSAFSCDTFFNR